MKLQKIDFVDIRREEEGYRYTYAAYATSFFRKHFMTFTFRSKIPHFWWSEIQKVMIEQGIYFEDLECGKPKKIKIGTLEKNEFSEADRSKYGTTPSNWKAHLNKACEKAFELKQEYDDKYGVPDMTGTGLFSEFEPKKEW